MTLTVIPQKPVFTGTAPNRLTQAQSVFSANADNMMGYMSTEPDSQNAVTDAMNTLANEVEQVGVNALNSEISASSSASIALSSANYTGEWSNLTGSLAKFVSVLHNSVFYMLNNDLADVTLSEPGVTSDWAAIPQNSGMKNRLINGGFDVWQEATTATAISAGGYYTADMITIAPEQGAIVSSDKISDVFVDGLGMVNAHRLTFTTAPTGPGTNLATWVEAETVKKMRGKTMTLSFYARANKNIELTSTTFFIDGIGVTGAYHAISTNWARFSAQLTLDATLDNDNMLLQFLRDASTSTIFAGDWVECTGLQLEEGVIATPFERRPYALELLLCQRYYETIIIEPSIPILAVAYQAGAVAAGSLSYQEKRILPAISFVDASSRVVFPSFVGASGGLESNYATVKYAAVSTVVEISTASAGWIDDFTANIDARIY